MRIMRLAIPVLAGLLLVVAIVARKSRGTSEKFGRTVSAADLSPARGDELVITNGDIVFLPQPVQRYLRFMGVVGRPRDWSFRAHMMGSFRTKPALVLGWPIVVERTLHPSEA
jgi:hypothetical protein